MAEANVNDDPSAEGGRRGGSLLRKLVLSLSIFVGLVLLSEVGLRIAGYGKGPGRYFESGVGYRFLPDQSFDAHHKDGERACTYVFNEAGFRGPHFDTPKAEGTTRIACVGDSFTFGWGVEENETFPALLSERLASRGESVEVSNFGVPGYNLWNSHGSYLRYTRPTQPDVVLIAFYLNDLCPPDPGPSNLDSAPMKMLGKTALMEAFHLHFRKHFSYFDIEAPEEMLAARDTYWANQSTIQLQPEHELSRPFWSRTMGELETLVAAAQEDAKHVFVVAFPSLDQLNRMRAAGPDVSEADRAGLLAPQRRVATECERLGVPLVDLFDGFFGADGETFGSLDAGHPSVLGYRVTADVIAGALDGAL